MATATEIQARLDAYLAAETEILEGQEMKHGDQSHRLADLKDIREQIAILERKLSRKNQSDDGKGSLGVSYGNMNKAGGFP